jgi:hypothetical protein
MARTGTVLAVRELAVSHGYSAIDTFIASRCSAGNHCKRPEKRMSKDDQEAPSDLAGGTSGERKPWFGPNRSGVGFRPYTWQGWLILVPVIAAIVTVVVLLRSGVL